MMLKNLIEKEHSFSQIVAILQTKFSPEVEQFFLDILKLDRLNITKNHELPHSLSGMDMIKSIVIQKLTEHTGLKHIEEMKLVKGHNQSRIDSIVQRMIEKCST